MCQSYNGDRTLLPITKEGLGEVIAIYASDGDVSEGLIRKVYGAMTDKLFVRIMHFVAVIDLIARYKAQEKSFWDFGPALLFSAHVPGTLTRFRSAEMTALHDSWLAFNMSERNRHKLDTVLAEHDMALISLCCCGGAPVSLADRDRALEASAEFNHRRTLADNFGRVIEDRELMAIPSKAISEQMRSAFFRIVENTIRVANVQGDCACHSLPNHFAGFDIADEEKARVKSVKLHFPDFTAASVAVA